MDDPQAGKQFLSSTPSLLLINTGPDDTPAADWPRLPSNRKIIRCPYADCEKTFNRQAKLAQHLNTHTNTRPFVCSHKPCTKDFYRSSHLDHHIKSAHNDQRDHVCEWEGCGRSFVTSTRLKLHHARHMKRQEFACSFSGCGQEFRKHNTLQKHIATVHQGKRKPFVCDQLDRSGMTCGASFEIEGNLKNHVNTVHSGKQYYCTICPVAEDSFPTLPALQAHIKLEHPPKCSECGSAFANRENLNLHFEAKHGNMPLDQRRRYPCLYPGCGTAFTLKSNLNKHVRAAHLSAEATLMRLTGIGYEEGQ